MEQNLGEWKHRLEEAPEESRQGLRRQVEEAKAAVAGMRQEIARLEQACKEAEVAEEKAAAAYRQGKEAQRKPKNHGKAGC